MIVTFIVLAALIANFEYVADFLERMDKRGTWRLGVFSSTFGAACIAAAFVIQLVTGDRDTASGFAVLGTLATAQGLSWLVSRWPRKPKRRRSRKRISTRVLEAKPPKLLASAESKPRTPKKRVRSTKR
jgi:4-amino-4-deoxy-L-arabinose transferase-like glycosyltransferase